MITANDKPQKGAHHENVTCTGCREVATNLKKCSTCFLASYCSRECQRKDWSQHKMICKKPVATQRDAKASDESPHSGSVKSHTHGAMSGNNQAEGKAHRDTVTSIRYGTKHHTMNRDKKNNAETFTPKCNFCRKAADCLKPCAFCNLVSYCSIDCQGQDYAQHKHLCKMSNMELD